MLPSAWRTGKDHFRRSLRAISETHCKIVLNLSDYVLLRLCGKVYLKDEAIESQSDLFNVGVVLMKAFISHIIQLGALKVRRRLSKVALDSAESRVCSGVQQDELIRHNTMLLQCQSLGLVARKALQDPRLVLGLMLLNLALDHIDHNSVINCNCHTQDNALTVLVRLLVLGYLSAQLSLLSHLVLEHRTSVDHFPTFFVGTHLFGDLLPLTARRTHQEDSLN